MHNHGETLGALIEAHAAQCRRIAELVEYDALHGPGDAEVVLTYTEQRIDDLFGRILKYKPVNRDELVVKASFLFGEVADSAEIPAHQRGLLDAVLADIRHVA